MSTLEYLKYSLIRLVVNTSLAVRRSTYFSPTTQPDLIKPYPCRPHLFPSRIFLPKDHDGARLLPLVIRAHGGGFIVNNPSLDDPLARYLADHASCIVVSIDYCKSPQARFPTAYEDVIAQVLAVLEDGDLPLDRRMIFSGHSAGGNLLLAAAQDPRIRSKLLAVSAIYPVTDCTTDHHTKMSTRPDPTIPDFIGPTWPDVLRLYLDPTSPPRLDDPRLSPAFFNHRSDYPDHVLLIGAEHDMFCHEAETLAIKLSSPSKQHPEQPEEPTPAPANDPSSSPPPIGTVTTWKSKGIQWHKIIGQRHAFENFPAPTPEAERIRLEAMDELYLCLAGWVREVCSMTAARGFDREGDQGRAR